MSTKKLPSNGCQFASRLKPCPKTPQENTTTSFTRTTGKPSTLQGRRQELKILPFQPRYVHVTYTSTRVSLVASTQVPSLPRFALHLSSFSKLRSRRVLARRCANPSQRLWSCASLRTSGLDAGYYCPGDEALPAEFAPPHRSFQQTGRKSTYRDTPRTHVRSRTHVVHPNSESHHRGFDFSNINTARSSPSSPASPRHNYTLISSLRAGYFDLP